MNKAWNKIKQTWEENPLAVIFIAGVAAQGAAKILHEVVEAKKANTWAREVDRRRMMI